MPPDTDNRLQLSADDLHAAACAGLITPAQIDPLLGFLRGRLPVAPASASPKFDMAHLLWYAGALIVMSAMGLFSTLAFSQMGGVALTITAVIYAIVFLAAGDHLWRVRKLRTPGGLLIAIAVSMAPLALYGVQDAMGLWSKFGKPGTVREFYIWIKGSWIFMELAAIAAAALALRFYRFPLIVLLAAIALWFLSMDLASWIVDKPRADYEARRQISLWFGLGMLLVAVIVNLRQRSGDFAFWLYLFGMLTFWGAITASSGSTDLTRALYCALNIGFLLLSVVMARTVFAVFGTIGIALYLGHLAEKTFKDSLLFPFALSLIGVAIIGVGLYVHRHRDAIDGWIEPRLPPLLRRLRAGHAA